MLRNSRTHLLVWQESTSEHQPVRPAVAKNTSNDQLLSPATRLFKEQVQVSEASRRGTSFLSRHMHDGLTTSPPWADCACALQWRSLFFLCVRFPACSSMLSTQLTRWRCGWAECAAKTLTKSTFSHEGLPSIAMETATDGSHPAVARRARPSEHPHQAFAEVTPSWIAPQLFLHWYCTPPSSLTTMEWNWRQMPAQSCLLSVQILSTLHCKRG